MESVVVSYIALVVAAFSLLVSVFQFVLAMRKRKDDLFIMRYNFYQKLSKKWLETYDASDLEQTDLIPYVEESYFLFGKDISKHIMSLEHKNACNPFFVESEFSKPFDKYLKL